MLQRIAQFAEKSSADPGKPHSGLTPYYDAAEIAPWARSAVGEAVYRGWINGRTAELLMPGHIATRAEAAAMIKRTLLVLGLLNETKYES